MKSNRLLSKLKYLPLLSLLIALPVSARSFEQCFDTLAAGRYSEAEDCFQQLLVQNKNDARSNYYLGQALRKHGEAVADTQKIGKSIDYYREALRLRNNDYAYAWNGLGNALNDLEKIDDSIEAYQSALKAPNEVAPPVSAHVSAYTNLASTFTQQKKFPQAMEELQKAIKIEPKYSGIYEDWGDILYSMGRLEMKKRGSQESALRMFRSAIEKYREAIRLNPERYEGYVGYGTVLMELEQYEAAIQQFQAASERSPYDLAYIYVRWGDALGSLGYLDQAIEKYRAATQLKSLSAQGHIAFAYVYWGSALATQAKNHDDAYRADKWADAIDKFQQALRYEDDQEQAEEEEEPSIHAIAHNDIGLIHWQRGDLELAKASFDEAIHTSSTFRVARSNFDETDRQILLRTKRPLAWGDTQFLPSNAQTPIKRSIVRVISKFWTNGGVEDGTGWVVARQGSRIWIATNRHIVSKRLVPNEYRDGDEIQIELYFGDIPDAKDVLLPRATARIVSAKPKDGELDLALLEVETSEIPEDVRRLAVSDQTSQRNIPISVVGNSDFKWVNGTLFNLSSKEFTLTPLLVQGYSGSPIFNIQNEAIGVLYEIDPRQGQYSYALPMNLVIPKLQEWTSK